MFLENHQKQLRDFCLKRDIEFLGVFGSVARGDDRPNSDVDFVVRFHKPISLFQLANAESELERMLQRPVDLVTEASIHPYISTSVQRDLKVLYDRT